MAKYANQCTIHVQQPISDQKHLESIKFYVEIFHLLLNLVILFLLVGKWLFMNYINITSQNQTKSLAAEHASHGTNNNIFQSSNKERSTNIFDGELIDNFIQCILLFNIFITIARFPLVQ